MSPETSNSSFLSLRRWYIAHRGDGGGGGHVVLCAGGHGVRGGQDDQLHGARLQVKMIQVRTKIYVFFASSCGKEAPDFVIWSGYYDDACTVSPGNSDARTPTTAIAQASSIFQLLEHAVFHLFSIWFELIMQWCKTGSDISLIGIQITAKNTARRCTTLGRHTYTLQESTRDWPHVHPGTHRLLWTRCISSITLNFEIPTVVHVLHIPFNPYPPAKCFTLVIFRCVCKISCGAA